MRGTIRPHQDALAELVAEYETRMAEHIEAINAEVEQFYDEIEPVLSDIADDLENAKPDPNEVEWPAQLPRRRIRSATVSIGARLRRADRLLQGAPRQAHEPTGQERRCVMTDPDLP